MQYISDAHKCLNIAGPESEQIKESVWRLLNSGLCPPYIKGWEDKDRNVILMGGMLQDSNFISHSTWLLREWTTKYTMPSAWSEEE